MSSSYQRLPTSPQTSRPSSPNDPGAALPPRHRESLGDDDDEDNYRPLRASVQAEFNRPDPAWWKRALIVIALLFMGWLSIRLGTWRKQSPEIIYATRYSEEFRYRPAASPIITEYLKDGRIRLRGATPGGIGVREEDIPKTPAQKKAEEKRRIEEARDAAKEKLGLKRGKGKGKSKSKNRKVRANGGKTEV